MLGSIRFLLALGVVISHTKGYRFDLYPDTGIVAVCAFFFLSGYLMPATLEKNYQGRAAPYLANRFLRIFPMYWIALAAALLILPQLPAWKDAYDFGLQPIVQNALLLGLNQWPNDTLYIGPAWTLDIELQYYLLVPILLMIPARLRLVVMGLVAAAGLWLFLNPTGQRHIDRSFLPWSGFFFLGTALYMWAPAARFFRSGSRLDRELGDLSYPLFIIHPLVIQAAGLSLGFWSLMAVNIALSVVVAYLMHRVFSPPIERFRDAVRGPEKGPARGRARTAEAARSGR